MASPSGKCAHCGKTSSRRCTGCTEGLDLNGISSPSFYCSKACQTAGWKQHKKNCRGANARKQLYRGAKLLQDIFYLTREAAFDIKIATVTVRNDGVVMREGALVHKSEGPIFTFPNQLVFDPKDKSGMLSYMACNDAYALTHELIQKILKGIHKSGEEAMGLQHRVKEEHWRIIRQWPNGAFEHHKFRHEAVHVRLVDGAAYIIDLAGAHMDNTVLYSRMIVLNGGISESSYKPLLWNFSAKDREAILSGEQVNQLDPSYDYRAPLVHKQLTERLRTVVEDWEAVNGTLAAMLNKKQQDFEHKQAKLLTAVNNAIQSCIQNLELPGDPQFVRAKVQKKRAVTVASEVSEDSLSEGLTTLSFREETNTENPEVEQKEGAKEARKRSAIEDASWAEVKKYMSSLPRDMQDFLMQSEKDGVHMVNTKFLG